MISSLAKVAAMGAGCKMGDAMGTRDWSGRVFVSDGLFVENAKPLMSQQTIDDLARSGDADRRNGLGEPLPRDRFPDVAWGSEDAPKTFPPLPPFFLTRGFPTLSPEAAEVVSRFDLGEGALYPVDIYQRDRERLIGTYHILNIGNQKNAFVPEASTGVEQRKRPAPAISYWRLEAELKKGDIAVDRSALDGPDIWVDPYLRSLFFLSGPLVRALMDAKATKGWRLREGRVVG